MYRLLSILIPALLMFGSFTTAQSDTGQQRRFSMAISGGASKGAYEAGLNWGLMKLLKNAGSIDNSLIGHARDLEAASFSGASAGGINTLLSGLTWCSLPEAEGGLANSIDSNIYRDVWLIPDVNRLLPPQADSGYYSKDDALLSRHDLLQASAKLRERWNQPGFRADCRIPLGVTVTRVVPDEFKVGNVEVQNQRLFIPFEARTRDDGTLGFYFDPDDFPVLPDPARILLPRERNAPPNSIEDQRIEDAVVTSAAYPGGFGRKRLQYCRLSSFAAIEEEQVAAETNLATDAASLVCPDGYELEEAEFADGGLFDNLPLGLARKLAEDDVQANTNTLPVTYIYLDPNRRRYKIPPPAKIRACDSENPPDACRTMDFSLLTEHALFLGAYGTARKYELYRELTSEYWSLNLAQLGYELANSLERAETRVDCVQDIPFFSTRLDCAESIRRAASLLELSYNNTRLTISPPYSVERLQQVGLASECKKLITDTVTGSKYECKISPILYRKYLAEAFLSIADGYKKIPEDFADRVNKAKLSMHNDRVLRVTDRGAPITGTLLSDFGAFLDLKFRQYDYYVGIYDAVIAATQTLCGLKFSEEHQQQAFGQCENNLAEAIYQTIEIDQDPRGRYVFARLARWEFGEQNNLRFAYEPMPEEDHDMRIIFEGLIKTLEAGQKTDDTQQGLFFTENTFFQHLNKEDFVPTPTADGSTPLLAQIIADPTNWPYELTRRATTRFVYLEKQAENIYKAREPDPELRETSHTTLMGMGAFTLQTATYNYPDFTFSPSTAPDHWVWRNIIPYELGFDLVDNDITFTWQPTWSLSSRDLLSIRAGLALTRAVSESGGVTFARENYGSLGLSYSRQTSHPMFSSWGLTASWYHQWSEPDFGKQDTPGGDVHVSFFRDRIRLGLGVRDFNDAGDTWSLTVGFTDLPGWIYWLSR